MDISEIKKRLEELREKYRLSKSETDRMVIVIRGKLLKRALFKLEPQSKLT
jgi:hypothetical protein